MGYSKDDAKLKKTCSTYCAGTYLLLCEAELTDKGHELSVNGRQLESLNMNVCQEDAAISRIGALMSELIFV